MRKENYSSKAILVNLVSPELILNLLLGTPRLQGQVQEHPADIHLSLCRILLPTTLSHANVAYYALSYYLIGLFYMALFPSRKHSGEIAGSYFSPSLTKCPKVPHRWSVRASSFISVTRLAECTAACLVGTCLEGEWGFHTLLSAKITINNPFPLYSTFQL